MMSYTYETYTRLVEQAKKYERAEDFIDDAGWDVDWMPYLIENPDEEILSENDIRTINEELVSAFEEAHEVHFHYDYRWELINR